MHLRCYVVIKGGIGNVESQIPKRQLAFYDGHDISLSRGVLLELHRSSSSIYAPSDPLCKTVSSSDSYCL